jgi:hypothetical protein
MDTMDTLDRMKGCDEMTVKEYLMQVQTGEEQITDQKQYIETLRDSLTSIGGMNLTADKVQTSRADMDKLGTVIAKICEAEEKLKRMEEHHCLLKVQIAEQIHSMDNLLFKKLLNLRYLEWEKHNTMQKVADALCYSLDHTKKLHKDALCAFTEILRPHNT